MKTEDNENQLVLFDVLEEPAQLTSIMEAKNNLLVTARYQTTGLQDDIISYCNTKFLEQTSEMDERKKYRIGFSQQDVEKVLGMKRGGRNWQILFEAVCDMSKKQIGIWDEAKQIYDIYNILTHVSVDVKNHYFEVDLNEAVFRNRPFMAGYAKILLIEKAQFKSFYTKRLFAYLKSFAGKAGKDGNKRGEWYVNLILSEFLLMCGKKGTVKDEEMKEYKKAVFSSLKEIQTTSATLSIVGKPTPIKEGKKVVGYKIVCKNKGVEYLISLLKGKINGYERIVDDEDPRLKKVMKKKELFLQVFCEVLKQHGFNYDEIEECSEAFTSQYLLEALTIFDEMA